MSGKVEAIWFWAVLADGKETVLAFTDESGASVPLMCSSEAALETLGHLAVHAAMAAKVKATLVRFSHREEFEEVDGPALAAIQREAFKRRNEDPPQ